MKKLALLGLAFLTVCAIIAFTVHQPAKPFDVAAYKAKGTARCSPDWKTLTAVLDAMDIPPMPDAGIYKWKINTTSDSAQFYFNQGINMYYGFHIIEALASFNPPQWRVNFVGIQFNKMKEPTVEAGSSTQMDVSGKAACKVVIRG